MVRTFSIVAMLASASIFISPAHADDDELVRLPGQGEVRNPIAREKAKAERLKPAGGLFISFDSDDDGFITTSEIGAGIPVAFKAADENKDGYLTAIEQQAWAESLPTRDETLANPFRFDPNLDRRVDIEEFTKVISDLGIEYANETTGNILATELKAPKPERRRTLNPFQDEADRKRPNGQRGERVRGG